MRESPGSERNGDFVAHIIYVAERDLKYLQVEEEENLLVEAKDAWDSLGEPEMWVFDTLQNAPWHILGTPKVKPRRI